MGFISVSFCAEPFEFFEDVIVGGALLLDKLPELRILSGEDVSFGESLVQGSQMRIWYVGMLSEEGI